MNDFDKWAEGWNDGMLNDPDDSVRVARAAAHAAWLEGRDAARDDLIQCLLATRGQSEGATADAILSMFTAAPAVHGEPVAEVVWPDVGGRRGGFRQFGHCSSPRLPVGTKLYAAPQPAEQQPDPTDEQIIAITTAYEQGVGKGQEALCSGEEIQNPYDSSWGCDKAWQLGYEVGKSSGVESSVDKPQPVPDVSALVEALTMARETIASALRASAPDYYTTDANIARHFEIRRIDAALAAHRKQGGEV